MDFDDLNINLLIKTNTFFSCDTYMNIHNSYKLNLAYDSLFNLYRYLMCFNDA